MYLKKIILKNIRSYIEQEVEFPKGSVLLSGDIGSGKTSVLLGIEFALFGLQPGQRGSALLRNGSKEGKVILEFEVDGKNIIIERTLKRGKTVSQDYSSITIDNEKKEISVTELKNEVLELLNYPKEFSKKQNLLYKFTVYTPQEEMKEIIQEDSETRIDTLRHVFGIDKYKRILENTSIIISKVREEKRKREGVVDFIEQDKQNIIVKENELSSKQSNLLGLMDELLLSNQKRKRIEQEQEEIEKRIDEKTKFESEIEKTKIMLANKAETIFSNRKMIQDIEMQIQQLKKFPFDESKIFNLNNEILAKKKEKEKMNEENLRITSQISSINLKNEEIRNLKDKISKIDICPTCLQDVDSVYKSNVINKADSDIAEGNKKIESLTVEKGALLEKLKQINSEILLKENALSDLRILRVKLQQLEEKESRILELQKINNSFEKDIEILNSHNEILKQSVFDLSKFDNIYNIKQKELQEALREERVCDIKVAELKKEIDVFSKQIEEIRENIKRAEEIKNQLNYLTELEDWLNNKFIPVISFIEKNVMIKLKKEFSELFSSWFYMLVSDSFNVHLGDDFTPIIEQSDYELDYAYLSGGERTAVALAYRLALNQVINSLLSRIKTKSLVILDEPTDGFSEQQLDKMRDVFQQLNMEQLILVSHEQKIEGFVENVLKFKKENGITRVE